MCLPFSSAATLAHTFRSPTKVIGFGSIPSCCIRGNNSNAFSPCPQDPCPIIMAFQETKSCVGMLLNTFSASSMLPHVAYMSMRLLATKILDSWPHLMICSWTCLPMSSASILAHAFTTPTKVTGFCLTLSLCICWNSSNAFSASPHFTCPRIRLVQETTSRAGILLKTCCASSMLPHLAYMSTRLLATKISE